MVVLSFTTVPNIVSLLPVSEPSVSSPWRAALLPSREWFQSHSPHRIQSDQGGMGVGESLCSLCSVFGLNVLFAE